MMRSGDFTKIVEPAMYAARRDKVALGHADGGGLPTLRAGQDAYGASIQQVNAPGSSVPAPPDQGGMSQTDFAGRGKPDADKIARQQEQLRKMLQARGDKPVKKARGGGIHPAIHHHIAHALIKLAEGGTVDEHAHDAAHSPYNELPEPTEKQRAVGNYKKGKTSVSGLQISIENPAGSKRRPEWPELKSHYGYATGGTPSSDGDHVDVFVKPGTPLDHNGPVHVIDQLHPNGTFDEIKAMVGWPDKESALAGYNENHTEGWKGAGAVTAMPHEKFKDWVHDGVKSAPMARKAFTRAEGGDYLCTGGLTQ